MTFDATTAGIILTFIVGAINLILTWRSLKQTAFINSVTSARRRWMDEVRRKMTEFCKSCYLLVSQNNNRHPHKGDIMYQITLMKLLLNPSDQFDKGIIEQMEIVKNKAFDLSLPENEEPELNKQKKLLVEIDELISKTQDLLKLEWEGVKEESYHGRLSKEKKTGLYNKYLRGKNRTF